MIERILKEADLILEEIRKEKIEVDIDEILSKEKISYKELLALLLDDRDENLIKLGEWGKKITERYFGKVITLFTPLYLSNYCLSGCKYCGFSADNKIDRIKLSREEIIEEIKEIKKHNIDSILLLTGCDRINTPFEYILEAVEISKDYFSEVIVEVYPMEIEEYKILVKNGLTGVTQYQETYNEKLYEELHPYGPKKNFWYRLHTQERAIKGGVWEVTLGVLLGLNDPVEDVFKMILHAEYLQRKFSNIEVNISFPRLRTEGISFKERFHITDKKFLRFIFVSRVYLKNVGITISTRESPTLRDMLIGYGITKMSAGSRTTVGGYSREKTSSKQFKVEDSRGIEEIIEVIRKKGYRPEFTNWVRGGIV